MVLKYDLGGLGKSKDGFLNVNLVKPCNILADIMKLDSFCQDGTVDEFRLVHTLEHIPSVHYVKFLKDMQRKLKLGGCIWITFTDTGKVLDMLHRGELAFRSARTTIFTPADRLRQNQYHLHHNMWSEAELINDFNRLGFKAESFDAGTWVYNQIDELFPEITKADHGKRIPNLGVKAIKV